MRGWIVRVRLGGIVNGWFKKHRGLGGGEVSIICIGFIGVGLVGLKRVLIYTIDT